MFSRDIAEADAFARGPLNTTLVCRAAQGCDGERRRPNSNNVELIKKHLFPLVFGVILAVARSAFSLDTIKIGEFGSFTGDNASFGMSQNNGVQMAIEEVNAAGGMLNCKPLNVAAEGNSSSETT